MKIEAPTARRQFRGPRPAETARTICASASSLTVGTGGDGFEARRHLVLPDGGILYVPGASSPERALALAHGTPGHLVKARAIDLVPVPVADRIRGAVGLVAYVSLATRQVLPDVRAHLLGDGPDAPILHLEPRAVMVERSHLGHRTGPVEVDLDEFRLATPDPLWEVEGEWLRHLDADHRDVLEALAELALPGEPSGRVRPVALGRFGVVLRCGSPMRDVHVAFASPLGCGCDLAAAFAELIEIATPGGPRLDCAG